MSTRHPDRPGRVHLADAWAPGRPNRFGLARLLLAFAVIVSHAPELVDGDRTREPLHPLTDSFSLGDLAVQGFFLVSGFLVTASYVTTGALLPFCCKRAARILPGFVAAFLLTLLVAGGGTGGRLGTLAGREGLRALAGLATLQPPALDGALSGAPDPRLNQSMWTIAYEARCYALVALLGAGGWLRGLRACLYLWCMAALLLVSMPYLSVPRWLDRLVGGAIPAIVLLFPFLTGACFFLLRHRLVMDGRWAAVAVLACGLALPVPTLFLLMLPVLGGYALFWAVFAGTVGRVGRMGRVTDISYGLYLYAWPVEATLVWACPGISPLVVAAAATPAAALLGLLSWLIVERPAVALNARFLASRGLDRTAASD